MAPVDPFSDWPGLRLHSASGSVRKNSEGWREGRGMQEPARLCFTLDGARVLLGIGAGGEVWTRPGSSLTANEWVGLEGARK